MTQSELNQVKHANSLLKRSPEQLKNLFFSGKLRLCSEAMLVLYYHYISGKTFRDMLEEMQCFNEYEITIINMFNKES